jgi:hypothetical protein
MLTSRGLKTLPDYTLDLFRRIYEELAVADNDLKRVAPWWLQVVRSRPSLGSPPLLHSAEVIAATLEGAENQGAPPSPLVAERESVSELISYAPTYDAELAEAIAHLYL